MERIGNFVYEDPHPAKQSILPKMSFAVLYLLSLTPGAWEFPHVIYHLSAAEKERDADHDIQLRH